MDIPLIEQQDSLLGRLWNRSYVDRQYQTELRFWVNHQVVVPWASLDTALSADNVPYLRSAYPTTTYWLSTLYLRPGVNIPTPSVVFYYDSRMMATTSDQERVFWGRVLELE